MSFVVLIKEILSYTGCVCDHGWVGSQCDIDIDECVTGQVVCSGEKSVCVNILGSAFCSCETGYKNLSGICQGMSYFCNIWTVE